ncbi:MAG TPA: CHAD domain-containing protein [Vicinamibacterales bacterium]
MPVPAELYASLRKRVNVFSHQAKRIDEGNADALHRTRVSSRRLRELLPVLRLDGRTTRKLDRRLRRVTRRLGAVRDLDVLMDLVGELQRDRRYSKNALRALQTAVEEKQQAARDALNAKLSIQKLQKIARALKRAAKQVDGDDGETNQAVKHRLLKTTIWVIEARAARRATRVQEAIEAAGTVYIPAPLHQVRIALKKLRFALELSAEVKDEGATREITVLRNAQGLLGRLHDLQVLTDHAREMQASRVDSDPSGWRDFASLVRLLERDCRTLHARYVRVSPKLLTIAGSVCDVNKRHAGRLLRRAAGERLLA